MKTKPKVLVLDDEQDNLDMLARALRQRFEVVKSAHPEEAIELCSLNEFNVIISDQRMPGMNGVEFLSRILPRQPKAIRILLTGYSEYEAAVGAINLGHVDRYFSKPLNLDELYEFLDDAMRNLQIDGELQSLYNRLQTQNRQLLEENRVLREEVLRLQKQLDKDTSP